MNLLRQSADVYLAPGPVCRIGSEEIDFLVGAVASSSRGRVRINAHAGGDDSVHEMVIAILPGSYIRPHKHPGKSESFHMIRGAVDVVIFDDRGEVTDIVALDAEGKQGGLYYRMSEPMFHTLIIRSPILVVHEITNGPFVPGGTIFAAFSPEEQDTVGVERYIARVKSQVIAFSGRG